jgi:circadian clock protein KaiC
MDTPTRGLLSFGVAGLDDILHGGLAPGRMYLLEGDPGTGKTTLALQFLLEGAKRGERCLFVSFSETEEEVRAAARAHGWSLEGCTIAEVNASDQSLKPDTRYTMFHPSEVELGATIDRVITEAQRINPQRVVVDSLSELRLLAAEPLRYRRQVLALKDFFTRPGSTMICTDDKTGENGDMHHPQHFPRGAEPRAAHAGVRHHAPPPASHQDARDSVPRGLPRLSHRARRTRCLSPAGRR